MNSENEDGANLEINEGESLEPPPQGAPADFRERLVLALKTTDPATLAAAERDFRGCYRDVDEYVRMRLAKYMPAWLAWCLSYAPYERLLATLHEQTRCIVWTISLKADQILVFESPELSAARRKTTRDSLPR